MTDLPDNPDRDLHNEIPVHERLVAILEAPGLNEEQTVEALDAFLLEKEAQWPHLLVIEVTISSGEKRNFHVGPFRDRQSAEEWASEWYGSNEASTYHTKTLEPPGFVEQRIEQARRIVEDN